MRVAAALLAVLALGACGSTQKLAPAPGAALPVTPYGATATPTPEQLLLPTVQARPQRTDELLRRSEPRRPDPFDQPPR